MKTVIKAKEISSISSGIRELANKIKDFFEIFLFFLLTLLIYGLFIFTIPIGQDPHGWLAINGFDNPLWLNSVNWIIFGSALICALLGILMMNWVPILTPEVIRNLWAATYFFIWIDTVFALTLEYKTTEFLQNLMFGLAFIFIFFYLIRFLGFVPHSETLVPNWKIQLVQYWTLGWMSFYFALSLLLLYNSYKYSDLRLSLSFGALVICFLNYIFSLFIQKAEGKNTDKYSKMGRVLFGGWLLVLIVCALGTKWTF